MAYGTLYLQDKWFSEASPTNPKKSKATLTFTDVVVAKEVVTIGGTEKYEFIAAGNATAGHIKVDVSTGLTSKIATEKLVAAITANSLLVDAVVDKDEDENDIVVITCKKIGTEGNDITVATTCTNASFGTDVTKLSGGQYGTPSMMKNVVVYATPYHYWCEKEGGKETVSWKRFIPADY